MQRNQKTRWQRFWGSPVPLLLALVLIPVVGGMLGAGK